MVRKLSLINKEPRVIWKAFDKHYGYGFFFDVLETEFGITPDTRDNLISRFDSEIDKFKSAASNQISTIAEKTQSELDRLRKELDDRNFEISMLKQKHLVEIDRVKINIADAMELKLQG